MHAWDSFSGESVMAPIAMTDGTLDGEFAMLLDSADDTVTDPPDPDEERWFTRQTRQKQAQKLYRHALPVCPAAQMRR